MRFSIDTSALLDGWARWYPPDVFPSVWEQMEASIRIGDIIATDDVREELERKADDLHAWCVAIEPLFIPLDADVQRGAREVLAQFPKLLDERRGKSMADPFVIAPARVHGLTVVTGEKGGTADRPKIPNICQHFGCRCIDIVTMIRELGWKF